MAVRHGQVLSEETPGYIKASCHCARVQCSALISSKLDMVWERSVYIRPPGRVMNILSTVPRDRFTKNNFTLSMFYFPDELLGPDLFPAESQV